MLRVGFLPVSSSGGYPIPRRSTTTGTGRIGVFNQPALDRDDHDGSALPGSTSGRGIVTVAVALVPASKAAFKGRFLESPDGYVVEIQPDRSDGLPAWGCPSARGRSGLRMWLMFVIVKCLSLSVDYGRSKIMQTSCRPGMKLLR